MPINVATHLKVIKSKLRLIKSTTNVVMQSTAEAVIKSNGKPLIKVGILEKLKIV